MTFLSPHSLRDNINPPRAPTLPAVGSPVLSHEAGTGIAASRLSAYVCVRVPTVQVRHRGPEWSKYLPGLGLKAQKGFRLLEQDSDGRPGLPEPATATEGRQEKVLGVPGTQQEKER